MTCNMKLLGQFKQLPCERVVLLIGVHCEIKTIFPLNILG